MSYPLPVLVVRSDRLKAPMFEIHRGDCRDLRKARQRDLTILEFGTGDPEGDQGPLINGLLYGGQANIRRSDWREMGCLG